MARVAPDADVLIGLLDRTDTHHGRARELLGGHIAAGDEVVLAASTYAEVMVRPLRLGRPEAVEDFLAAAGVAVIPIIRERHGRPPACGPITRACGCPTPSRSRRPGRWARACSPSTGAFGA